MPTISVSASIVIWLMVKFSADMTPKAPMIDAGMATAAMSVERKLRRKTNTMTAARKPPRIRCSSMAASEARMNSESSRIRRTSKVGGSVLRDFRHARADGIGQRDRVDAALLPDRDRQRRLAVEGGDRRRIGAACPRRCRHRESGSGCCYAWRRRRRGTPRGRVRRPTVRTESSRTPCSSRPPGQLEVLRAQRRGDIRGREP